MNASRSVVVSTISTVRMIKNDKFDTSVLFSNFPNIYTPHDIDKMKTGFSYTKNVHSQLKNIVSSFLQDSM